MMRYNQYDVVIITQTFFPDLNGTAKVMTDLALYLVKMGKKVVVLTANRSYESPEREYAEFEQHDSVDIVRARVPKLNKNKAVEKVLLYHSFSSRVKGILQRLEYKVAVSVLPPFFVAYSALRVSKEKGARFIFLVHDLHPDTLVRRHQLSARNPIVRLLKHQNQHIFDNADRLVFLGRDQVEYVERNYKVSARKVAVITNWGEKVLETPTCTEKNDFKILYSGNLGEASINLFNFLSIMKDLNETDSGIKLKIIGEGRKKKEYIEYIQRNKLKNVEIRSFLPDEEYKRELATSDALLVTLREESKGMSVPSKVYTYLGCGKPIISLVPIGSEIDLSINEDGYGINLNRLTREQTIENILKLKNDRSFYDKFCRNAETTFGKKYEKSIVLAKYLEMIDELEEDI